jgi:hypothetical protein
MLSYLRTLSTGTRSFALTTLLTTCDVLKILSTHAYQDTAISWCFHPRMKRRTMILTRTGTPAFSAYIIATCITVNLRYLNGWNSFLSDGLDATWIQCTYIQSDKNYYLVLYVVVILAASCRIGHNPFLSIYCSRNSSMAIYYYWQLFLFDIPAPQFCLLDIHGITRLAYYHMTTIILFPYCTCKPDFYFCT